MNRNLDQQSCLECKMCYGRNTPQCNDACKRCSIAMFSEDEVNIYPFSQQGSFGHGSTYSYNMNYPYTMNYPYGYPKHSPTPKSFGRVYYNYPKVTNQYYPSMLPYGNYYGSLYRPGLTYW
jgi:hypothetical protein